MTYSVGEDQSMDAGRCGEAIDRVLDTLEKCEIDVRGLGRKGWGVGGNNFINAINT